MAFQLSDWPCHKSELSCKEERKKWYWVSMAWFKTYLELQSIHFTEIGWRIEGMWANKIEIMNDGETMEKQVEES